MFRKNVSQVLPRQPQRGPEMDNVPLLWRKPFQRLTRQDTSPPSDLPKWGLTRLYFVMDLVKS